MFLSTGIGVPLMLTYVYGVVVLSLCRSRSSCGRSQPGDLGVVELENLTKRESCTASCPLVGTPAWCCTGCDPAAVAAPQPGASCWPGAAGRLQVGVMEGAVSVVQSTHSLGPVHVPRCKEL